MNFLSGSDCFGGAKSAPPRNDVGFTLIEVLLTVVVLGVAAGVLNQAFTGSIRLLKGSEMALASSYLLEEAVCSLQLSSIYKEEGQPVDDARVDLTEYPRYQLYSQRSPVTIGKAKLARHVVQLETPRGTVVQSAILLPYDEEAPS